MKIKVFILFSVLFLGVGFEGFGQVTFEDIFPKVRIEVDTAHVSLYKKLQIIRKCEYLGVFEGGIQVGHFYSRTLQADSTWYVRGGHSLVSRIILLSTQNNGIIDMVIQPSIINYGEGGSAAIWTLNKEGKYKRKKLFDGGDIKRVYRDENNILKIEIELSGCCDNYFMCDEIYSYENDSLVLQEQICYLRTDRYVKEATELKENRTFTTTDTAYLIGNNPRGYGDFVEMVDYTAGKDSIMQYDYNDEVVAVVPPNQKGRVLATRFVDDLYWYLIVFPSQSIQRRVFDYMIGDPRTKFHFAGWIKSKTPLKIE